MIRSLPVRTAALSLALLLGGCLGLGGGKLPDTLIALTATQGPAAGSGTTGKIGDALVVLEPEVDRKLAVLKVPVQVDAASVAYLADAAWVERPARQFRALLAETLRAGGKRLVIEEDNGSAGPTAHRLGGRLIDMGYDAADQAVVVRFEAVRTGPGGTVATRRFESVVPGVSATPQAIGPALNRAANAVAAEVAAWVG
ncbi:MAG: ABC-type transport auxiliary lipoprotein family protein [Brevundimonas sp.]|jgi:cholesterol transport system auxiliary component|nr:ABC-type transport auxiliary lipoprotein family protein [Brevundimonas sp.]MCZ8321877.1 ABC-type transport auxiliary lipoprotein family protein [Novosphingobium sp.]